MDRWLLGDKRMSVGGIRIRSIWLKLCMLQVASGVPGKQCGYIDAQGPMLYSSRIDSSGDMSREVEASSAVLLYES